MAYSALGIVSFRKDMELFWIKELGTVGMVLSTRDRRSE